MLDTPPLQCWAIEGLTTRCRWIATHTVRRTRREAIAAWLVMWQPDAPGASWEHWKRKGYKAIKVTVSPMSPHSPEGEGNV